MSTFEKIIILIALFAFMMHGIYSREMYQFGGESILFLAYLGWFIYSFKGDEE